MCQVMPVDGRHSPSHSRTLHTASEPRATNPRRLRDVFFACGLHVHAQLAKSEGHARVSVPLVTRVPRVRSQRQRPRLPGHAATSLGGTPGVPVSALLVLVKQGRTEQAHWVDLVHGAWLP